MPRLSFAAPALLVSLLVSASSVAWATDGLLEINQACAVNTGCFPGDSAGFPVTITTAGSYRVTGNLTVPSGSTTAIDVDADDVAIDLNGFTLAGPNTCTGSGPTLDCGTGGGLGIDAQNRLRVSVEKGRVRGFGGGGVIVGHRSHVRDLIVASNAGIGISGGLASMVSGSTAFQNEGVGIAATVVERCHVSANQLDGISSGTGCSLIGNVSLDNGRFGVLAFEACVVRNNAAHGNGDDGFRVAGGSLVSDNAAYDNGSDGIQAEGVGITIQRNTVTSNTGSGLNLSLTAAAAFRENTAYGNAVDVAGGVDMDANSCGGATSCP